MYEGSNTKALRSQAWLAAALEALMLEKPYEKITVSDICSQADLSRQTFYNVFSDKNEVLHYILRSAYIEQLHVISARKQVTIDDIVDGFAAVLNAKCDTLRVMVESGLSGIVTEEIFACVSLFAGRFVRESEKTALFPYSEAMLAGAISQMLVLWFQQGSPVSTDELAGLLRDFMSGRVYRLESE